MPSFKTREEYERWKTQRSEDLKKREMNPLLNRKLQSNLTGQTMKKVFGLSVQPGSRAYMRASRVSWWLGIFAALVLFALIPHWYVALPIALFGFGVATGLCGTLWFELGEVLNCTDRLHRTLAGLRLIFAIPIGLIALFLVPNWSDFEFNGHPSLVAMAGSVLLGILSFILGAGIVLLIGQMLSLFVLRLLGRGTHAYREGITSIRD